MQKWVTLNSELSMKPQILRNPESSQVQISLAENYLLFLAAQSQGTEEQFHYQSFLNTNWTPYAGLPPEDLIQKLEENLPTLAGCLIDHRSEFQPKIFLSQSCFFILQEDLNQTRTFLGVPDQPWLGHELKSQPKRLLGGSHQWVQDLGIKPMVEILNETPLNQNMNQLLFQMSRERHCLGFEDPTPFLFGVEEFASPYLA